MTVAADLGRDGVPVALLVVHADDQPATGRHHPGEQMGEVVARRSSGT
jgi:hypothetical protein